VPSKVAKSFFSLAITGVRNVPQRKPGLRVLEAGILCEGARNGSQEGDGGGSHRAALCLMLKPLSFIELRSTVFVANRAELSLFLSRGPVWRVTLPTNIPVNYTVFDSQGTQIWRRGRQDSWEFCTTAGRTFEHRYQSWFCTEREKNGMSFLEVGKEPEMASLPSDKSHGFYSSFSRMFLGCQ
jgi:hypothetical protein